MSSEGGKKINYADDSGLTSDLGLSYTPDGIEGSGSDELAHQPKSVGEVCIEKLGKPAGISKWPTGTLEFVNNEGVSDEDCCDAVKATVSALQNRMSTHPPKILVLYGSVGDDSKSKKLAIEAGRILSTYGSSVKVYDPKGLPVFSLDLDPESVEKAKELRELVMWCEAMVWISPEIHGNMSACFKNQIDWIPLSTGAVRPTQGKTVSVMQVEAGSQSFNTVNNLRVLARWMRMICTPNQSSIPRAYMEFDEETGEMKQSSLRDRVVDVMDELFKYTILLRDQQPYLLQRYSEKNKK